MNRKELKRFIDGISESGEITVAITVNEGIFDAVIVPKVAPESKKALVIEDKPRLIRFED